jgi:hypothetical protein
VCLQTSSASDALIVEGQVLYEQMMLGIEDCLRCRVAARRLAVGEGLFETKLNIRINKSSFKFGSCSLTR